MMECKMVEKMVQTKGQMMVEAKDCMKVLLKVRLMAEKTVEKMVDTRGVMMDKTKD